MRKQLTVAVLFVLSLVAVVAFGGRRALSQERVLAPGQLVGSDVLLARSASGIEVWAFDGGEWQQLANGPAWSDAGGWNRPEYYSTIQTGDIDGDGRAELLARGAGGMQAWEYEKGGWHRLPDGPAWSDAGGWNAPEYYSTIHTGDIDGDGRDELLARSASGIQVWAYEAGGWEQLPDGPAWSDAAGWNSPEYYSTIQTDNVYGHAGPGSLDELLARYAQGIEVWQLLGAEWFQLSDGPAWSDADDWNAPEHYSTIQTGDVDGERRHELLGRGWNYMETWDVLGAEWFELSEGPVWSDANGWDAPATYSTIQTGNIDGDGRDELLARSVSGIEVWAFDRGEWQRLPNGPSLSDAAGWDAAQYYSTIQTADIDGDGRAELLARSAIGIHVWAFDGSAWQQLPDGPAWSDAAGWNRPEYYGTIQTADLEGLATINLPTILAP